MVESSSVRFFFCISREPSAQPQQPSGAGKSSQRNRLPAAFGCDGQSQTADPVLISKLLDPADDLIVAGVTVCFAAYLTDLLHGVNDDEIGIRVLLHEILQLFIQPIPNLSGGGGEVEVGGIVHAVHHKHPALDTLKIVSRAR